MNFETRKKKLMDIRRCALDMQNGTLPPSMMASLLASISTAIIVGVIMKQDPLFTMRHVSGAASIFLRCSVG